MKKPRDFQGKALTSIDEAFLGHQRVLLQLATGLGKTTVFSWLLEKRNQLGRALVLAHTEELVEQAVKEIEDVAGLHCEIEMGNRHAEEGFTLNRKSDVIVSSIQSQIARKRGCPALRRMHKFDPMEFATIIADEGHRGVAKSWRQTIDYFTNENPAIRVLYCSATPKRGDGRALGIVCQATAYEMSIQTGIKEGWLVPIDQQAVYIEELDFSDVRTTAGELNQGDLKRVIDYEPVMHKIALAVVKYAGDRKTLVFTPSVACADRTAEVFNREKSNSARFVSGAMDKEERRENIRAFRESRFQYLVNCNIATEGFNVPDIACVVPSPTKSSGKYEQQAGRGTRALPGVVDGPPTAQERRAAIAASGKPNLLILDIFGVSGQHKLIHAEDLLGGDYTDEVRELAQLQAKSSGIAQNIEDRLLEASLLAEERRKEREKRAADDASSRQHVRAKATMSCKSVDPFAAIGYEPAHVGGYNTKKMPTHKMIIRLRQLKVPESKIKSMCFGEAGEMIGQLKKRAKSGKCAWQVAAKLSEHGIDAKHMDSDKAEFWTKWYEQHPETKVG